ncbi:prepilin-type N-terminal cleavage/methylation domain-containing protein [Oxalobacteraceae bacterium GrIS 2.11]
MDTKTMLSTHNRIKYQPGFTLAEMAIVIVLVGILLTLGLKMTTATLNNTAYSQTASKQAQIKIALINYLRSNGRLPCPDTAAVPTGAEVKPCSASAAASNGVLPWVALQLSRDAVQDGWGNLFTYKVANGLAPIAENWTATTGPVPVPFDITQLGTPSVAMTIRQGDGVNPLTTITTNAVVVIISGGKNGFGAKTILGVLNTAPPAANVDETTNATKASTSFVVRPYTDKPGSTGGPFDDLVVYLLPQDLLQPLTTEQTIASCKTYCSTPCTAAGTPFPYCTGANTPATAANASKCTAAGIPYAKCTGNGTPAVCTVPATSPVPIGNPTPSCKL